jgi:4,4'-diaponeurosporenoate glycosyltransferase
MTWLLVITLALWAAGFLLQRRLQPAVRMSPAEEPLRSPESVSIMIPARNEEHNLPRLLRSLAAQARKPHEIIVVNDASTDRTEEVARELGAFVIPSQPLPEGWRGKTWACHQGAHASSGRLLLFIDADTWFEPDALACIVSGYTGGALSLGPYHAIEKPYENLSLFFNLNMIAGTAPHGAFGQFLLIDRESYALAGGHATVKNRILENLFLTARFQELGTPVRSGAGRGVFSFRMYPHRLSELVAGWAKGFAAGAGRTPPRTLLLVVAWMIGLMLAPIGWLVTGDCLSWGAVYSLCAAQVWFFSRQIGAFHWYAAVSYPVPLIFFIALFTWSAFRPGKTVVWKGREIRAD